jgi:hypothetical protein
VFDIIQIINKPILIILFEKKSPLPNSGKRSAKGKAVLSPLLSVNKMPINIKRIKNTSFYPAINRLR